MTKNFKNNFTTRTLLKGAAGVLGFIAAACGADSDPKQTVADNLVTTPLLQAQAACTCPMNLSASSATSFNDCANSTFNCGQNSCGWINSGSTNSVPCQ